MKKQFSIICMLLLLCFVLSACGSSRLVGRWVEEDGNEMLIFRKDGTGSVDGFRFDWYISNGRLHVVLFDDEEMAYSVRGNKLSLQDVHSDGSLSRNVDVYIRQDGATIPIGTIVLCLIIIIAVVCFIRFGNLDKLLKHLPVDTELADSTLEKLKLESKKGDKGQENAVPDDKKESPDTFLDGIVIDEGAKEQIKVCPKCKAELPQEALFCPGCGRKVNTDTSTSEKHIDNSDIASAQTHAEDDLIRERSSDVTDHVAPPARTITRTNDTDASNDNSEIGGVSGSKLRISKGLRSSAGTNIARVQHSNIENSESVERKSSRSNSSYTQPSEENSTHGEISEVSPGMKRCPKCMKEIRSGAMICKYCRYEFLP